MYSVPHGFDIVECDMDEYLEKINAAEKVWEDAIERRKAQQVEVQTAASLRGVSHRCRRSARITSGKFINQGDGI